MSASRHTRRYDLFRTLLRELRRDRQITQVEIAAHLGLPQSFVSKAENGERRLDVVDLVDYLRAIGIRLEDFVPVLMQRLDQDAAEEAARRKKTARTARPMRKPRRIAARR